MPNRAELTARLQLNDLVYMFREDFIEKMFDEVTSGRRVQLGMKTFLSIIVNQWQDGALTDQVLVSDDFGETMPAFLFVNKHSPPKFKLTETFV